MISCPALDDRPKMGAVVETFGKHQLLILGRHNDHRHLDHHHVCLYHKQHFHSSLYCQLSGVDICKGFISNIVRARALVLRALTCASIGQR